MKKPAVTQALRRVETVLRRRPEMGLHDDAPAAARWTHGTRVVTSHANGVQMPTDMPTELGGTGDQVTPGWLFRAGLASCAATTIALTAAAEGIELSALEVGASSRSDTRGLLGMSDGDGKPVCAGPGDVQLHVRIAAQRCAPERLRALVEEGLRRSQVPNAVTSLTALAVQIDAA